MTQSCMWHDAFIHWTMRHSPPNLRCNINKSPLPPPTHMSNLCVGGYMCTCVCAVRESVHTLTHPPSHTYTLIRYVTRIILYTSRFCFNNLMSPPWHVQKIDPTLRVLDYFWNNKSIHWWSLATCVIVHVCVHVMRERALTPTIIPPSHMYTLMYKCNVSHLCM